MEEQPIKKNNKKLYLTIGVCILLVGMFILLNTYAFWRIKGEQSDSNYVVGACLNFEFTELDGQNGKIGGFTLEGDQAVPMTDEEGSATPGYTFKIENTCSKPVDYQVVLESLKILNNETETPNDYYPEEKYFADNKIRIQFDSGTVKNYGTYAVVDDDEEDTSGEIRKTRELLVGTIPGKTDDPNDTSNIVTHNLKMWISSESTNADIGKIFRTRIKVFAGQNTPSYATTDESCFDFDSSTGTITGYHKDECGSYVIVPPTINGVTVQNIAFHSVDVDYLDLSTATGLTNYSNGFSDYVGENQTLRFPDNLINIPNYAFAYFHGNSLILPRNVQSIGMNSFYSYDGDNLQLPESLETIDAGAFASYTGKKEQLIIPDNVTSIGNYAFGDYNNSDLTLGNNIDYIGNSAFRHYVGEGKNLVIPGTRFIDGYAFENYKGSSLTLNEGVETIYDYAFYRFEGSNSSLSLPSTTKRVYSGAFSSYVGKNLYLNEGLENIDTRTFYSYNGSNLTLPSTIRYTISDSAFYSYVGTGNELVVPAVPVSNSAFYSFNGSNLVVNATNISTNAFYSYEGVGKPLTIGAADIWYSAFYNYKGSKLTFNEGVYSIYENAFYSYNGEDITLPSTIRNVYGNAFASMDSSKTIYVNKPNLNGTNLASDGWHGQAKVMCMDNGNPIECP